MSCVPVRVDTAVSDDGESFSAVETMRRRPPRSSGLETKSKAPSLSARTADSTLPCAVIIAHGTPGQFARHPLEEFESIAVGQAHIGEAQIEVLRLEQTLRACDVAGRLRCKLHA